MPIDGENELVLKINPHFKGDYYLKVLLIDPAGNVQAAYPKIIKNTGVVDTKKLIKIIFKIPHGENKANYGLWNLNLFLTDRDNKVVFQYSKSFDVVNASPDKSSWFEAAAVYIFIISTIGVVAYNYTPRRAIRKLLYFIFRVKSKQ